MRLHHYLLAGLLISGAMSLSASTITAVPGGQACAAGSLCTAVNGATTIDFNGLAGLTTSFTDGFATYSWDFSKDSPFVSGSEPGEYAAPPDVLNTYLTVGSPRRPGSVTITFLNPINYFGFYMGSPDTYNSATFMFSGSAATQIFEGAQLLGPPNGDQSKGEFINFFSSVKFDRIEITSTSAAFETDNHAYGNTPEPGTLMILGAGLVGIALLRRRVSA